MEERILISRSQMGSQMTGDRMPINKVKGGYKWGSKGKVYKDRKGAERQAAAAYASGYEEPKKMRLGGSVDGVARRGYTRGRFC